MESRLKDCPQVTDADAVILSEMKEPSAAVKRRVAKVIQQAGSYIYQCRCQDAQLSIPCHG